MLGFIEQTFVAFGTFVVIRAAEPHLAWSRSVEADETALVKSRLSPAIARLLDQSGARVIRVLNRRPSMLATTCFVFPRTSIFIDYDERSLSSQVEDVIIAHEIAHFRASHPLLKGLIECFLAALAVSLGLQLAAAEKAPLTGLAVLLSVMLLCFGFLVFPLIRIVARSLEFDADAYAAKHVGLENTLVSLQAVKDVVPSRQFELMGSSFDERILHLRSRLPSRTRDYRA